MMNFKLTSTEKARTVASTCTSATLCTLIPTNPDQEELSSVAGAPWGSYVDYILADDGSPVLLVNEDSQHTKFFHPSPSSPTPMVSLFMQLGGNPNSKQDVSRVTLTGSIQPVPSDDPALPSLRMRYSITHAYADRVLDSPKFSFYKVSPTQIYYVGGFGVMSKWVDVTDYKHASSDILSKDASSIIASLNSQHSEDNDNVATSILGCPSVESVRCTSIDRLGVDFRVTYKPGRKVVTDEFRIGFRIPIMSVEDAKSECLKVYQEAWEIKEGFVYDEGEVREKGHAHARKHTLTTKSPRLANIYSPKNANHPQTHTHTPRTRRTMGYLFSSLHLMDWRRRGREKENNVN